MENQAAVAGSWEVRIARAREERDEIYRFRFDTFLSESGRWPGGLPGDRRQLREPADDAAVLFLSKSERRVVATARLRIGSVPGRLRDALAVGRFSGLSPHETGLADQIFVGRAFRRTGLLEALIVSVSLHSVALGARFLFAAASEDLAARLKPLGFREHTQTFVDPNLGPRVPLVLPLSGEASKWLAAEFPDVAASEQVT
jgi:hypothetical protein